MLLVIEIERHYIQVSPAPLSAFPLLFYTETYSNDAFTFSKYKELNEPDSSTVTFLS